MTSSHSDQDCATAIRSFDQSLPMALMRAREVVMRRFRPILEEHKLSEQQWRVLRALDDASRTASASMPVGKLAETTYLLGPSLSRMLGSLEERQLITRTTASDARSSAIQIAPAGHELVATIGPLSEAAYRDIEQSVGKQELAQLLRLLDGLADVA